MWALRTSAPLVRPPALTVVRSVSPLLFARAYSKPVGREGSRGGHSRTSLATAKGNTPSQSNHFERHQTPHSRKSKASSYNTRPSSRPSRSNQNDDNPWTTSVRLRRWIERHKTPLTPAQVDEVARLVIEAPQHMLNAPVWNMLIGYMGRLGKLDRVWNLYNQVSLEAHLNLLPSNHTVDEEAQLYAYCQDLLYHFECLCWCCTFRSDTRFLFQGASETHNVTCNHCLQPFSGVYEEVDRGAGD